jgi:hypothetical protein
MCLAVVGGTMDGEDLIASGGGNKVAQAGK